LSAFIAGIKTEKSPSTKLAVAVFVLIQVMALAVRLNFVRDERYGHRYLLALRDQPIEHPCRPATHKINESGTLSH